MRPYVIKQGDFLTRLGFEMGFDPQEVWDDPKNAPLKKLRGDRELLHPGDVLFVPEDARPQHDLAVGASNKFEGDVPTVKVSLVFNDSMGKPRSGIKVFVHGLGELKEDTTTGEGKLELDVPLDVRQVSVVFEGDPKVYHFRVGHLDPVTEPSGVRQRLGHLGYYVHRPGEAPELTRAHIADGLKRFQAANGLRVTGTVDDATRAKLSELHGS